MRSFQLIFIFVFSVLFLLTAVGSYWNLKRLLSPPSSRRVGFVFLLLNAAVMVGFLVLYVYPFSPREAVSISLYFYFNTILFALFLFNLPMSLAWLFNPRGRRPALSFAGLVISLGLAISMLFGTFIGSRLLMVREYVLSFEHLPAGFEDYRIVQLSDFHLGGMVRPERWLKKTRRRIDRLEPDMLLFTGDLVNNFAKESDGLVEYMQEISKGVDSYSILGNHDYGDYTRWESQEKRAANFQSIVESHAAMGFRLLRNEHVVLHRGADSLFLAGTENWGHPPFPQYANLDTALATIPAGAFTILMTHDPAHWESRVAGRVPVDLTLSGHTHGMQWGIKLAGIPFSVAYFTRKTWGGIYRHNQQVLCVNTGIGTVGMPWRLDMPGEVTMITLKRGKVD
ncbi:MAG: metallophosphoesterase [Mariniphaga sp.]|nr:metallophosphoesterase [Mariniphaga sp.]